MVKLTRRQVLAAAASGVAVVAAEGFADNVAGETKTKINKPGVRQVQAALSVVPRPGNVKFTSGEFKLPAQPMIAFGPDDKQGQFAAAGLASAFRNIGIQPQILSSGDFKNGYWLRVTALNTTAVKPPQVIFPVGAAGYNLDISDEIVIRASSAAGLFYGVQTLIQAVTAGQGTVAKCVVEDVPEIPLRGVMADLARLKEKDEYYFKLVDFMAEYKFNAIFMHFTDDQGAPIELKRHPKLTSDYAMSHDTIKRFVNYAAQRHIEVIPEIELWGHAGWVTGHPDYEDLSEEGPDLCTLNPKTWQLAADIFDEMCELFPSKYIHGGSDEAHFGRCPKCKAEVEKHGETALVGLHLKRTAELIYERGKIPILWADILLNYPESADIVPKYAILNHWNYRADLSDEPVKFLMSKGYTVIGGSGIVFGSRAVLPKGDALRNVENFGKIARNHKLLGINNTIWVPQRYVSDTLWYGIALAAEASWSGGEPDRNGLTTSFFKTFFGIDAGPDLLQAVTTLHELPAYVGNEIADVWKKKKEFDELATSGAYAEKKEYLSSILSVLKVMQAYSSKALRHKWEYGSLIYAAEMKVHIGERAVAPWLLTQAMDKAKELVSKGKSAAASKVLGDESKKLSALAVQEKRMADATEKYWDKWRPADDPKKQSTFQNTLNAIRTSDGYLKAIAERLEKAAGVMAEGKSPDWDSLLADV
ncbi:MAG: family 20 glycosylhydrolase [Armatimonadota bacterium]|nr:family 20 glycosylhydrolase [Armatimonadota bacterium]